MTKRGWQTTICRRRACVALLAAPTLGMRPAFADDASTVTVKVPVSPSIERVGPFAGFRFEFTRSSRKGEVAEYQRLMVKPLAGGKLQFHRRNDNGVAGSGVLATVKYSVEESPTDVTMKFDQAEVSSYQEGLILKKAVPAFSLKEVLLGGSVYARFELDSDYAVDAVRANFKRLAMLSGTPGGKETWRLTTPSGQQYVQVEFFPYRNGAKITASAVIVGRETSAGVIDFVKLLDEVQGAVRAVANA